MQPVSNTAEPGTEPPATPTSALPLVVRSTRLSNPFMNRPSAPLETIAFLDSFGPSLMPRASLHQGVAAGLSILAARATSAAVEGVIKRMTGRSTKLGTRLAARALVAGAGAAAAAIPAHDDEPTPRAALRSAGELAVTGALGGAVSDITHALERRYPAHRAVRPLTSAALIGMGTIAFAQRRLRQRNAMIQPWSANDKPANLLPSLGITAGVVTVGQLLASTYVATRRATVKWYGESPKHQLVARAAHAGIWAWGLSAAYLAGVNRIARANEKIEPAYSTPPTNPHVSGGEGSQSSFEDLGQQGRRFVTDLVDRELIESTMGEPAAADPVRVYIGFNSEPRYQTGRSEMALAEMERCGAFDRKYLLLVSPTGTGWVDQTLVESAELFARGDIATVCVQYGRMPSFLAVQKVRLGRRQFRQLLFGVRARIAAMPPEKRPKVLVFGESLGAWTSSDVVMHDGLAGLDWYGVDRALWVGLPGLAKWSKNGMREGANELVAPGTVRAFDNADEFEALSDEELAKLRVTILDHDNDPIALMSPRLGVKRPPWLASGERGRNVPEKMGWEPVITLVQVIVDAMNAMRVIPGEFKSFGHDYRGDMARFVHRAYGFEANEDQVKAVDEVLRRLEVERGERIKTAAQRDTGTAATGDNQ